MNATITLSGQGNISSFNSVTILGWQHTYPSDLGAYITNGTTTVNLVSYIANHASGSLNGNYTFATTGTDFNNAFGAPISTSATYASLQPLAAFNGSSLNGTWTLNVSDQSTGSVGSFTGFSFNVTTAAATPVPFEFEPTGAVMFLGGAWLLRKKLLKQKQPKD